MAGAPGKGDKDGGAALRVVLGARAFFFVAASNGKTSYPCGRAMAARGHAPERKASESHAFVQKKGANIDIRVGDDVTYVTRTRPKNSLYEHVYYIGPYSFCHSSVHSSCHSSSPLVTALVIHMWALVVHAWRMSLQTLRVAATSQAFRRRQWRLSYPLSGCSACSQLRPLPVSLARESPPPTSTSSAALLCASFQRRRPLLSCAAGAFGCTGDKGSKPDRPPPTPPARPSRRALLLLEATVAALCRPDAGHLRVLHARQVAGLLMRRRL